MNTNLRTQPSWGEKLLSCEKSERARTTYIGQCKKLTSVLWPNPFHLKKKKKKEGFESNEGFWGFPDSTASQRTKRILKGQIVSS